MMVSKHSRHINKGGEVRALDVLDCHRFAADKSPGWPIKKTS